MHGLLRFITTYAAVLVVATALGVVALVIYKANIIRHDSRRREMERAQRGRDAVKKELDI